MDRSQISIVPFDPRLANPVLEVRPPRCVILSILNAARRVCPPHRVILSILNVTRRVRPPRRVILLF